MQSILLAAALVVAGVEDAVVRIPSHGCSGTVIETGPGRSIILSCAHAFEGADARKPIRIDGTNQPHATKPRATSAVLVKVDYRLDLALIEVDNGPYWCVPVCSPGRIHARQVLAAGYMAMRWPVTEKTVEILGRDDTRWYTRGIPREGMSGGGLFDVAGQVLIGVVHGYEVTPGGRGLFVHLDCIHQFLGRGPPPPRARPAAPT